MRTLLLWEIYFFLESVFLCVCLSFSKFFPLVNSFSW